MKQFSLILFGGLAAIAVGVGAAKAGPAVWKAVAGDASDVAPQSVAAAAMAASNASDPGSSVSVSGLTKTIRYTADQEENMIDAAARSLPAGADGSVTATAYLVKDITTGSTAAQYSQDRLLPIASLTKLVTAIEARKLVSPDAKITITKEIMDTYGNTAQFKVGETYTAADLMYPMLMVSSNDAAEAFAQYYGRAAFISAMNQFVQSIGAYRTYFADPSGLSPLNESTASDMALILEWILKNDPDIIKITDTKTKIVRSHTWVNPTHFLNWTYYIGGKNGFTDQALETGASLFLAGSNKDTYAVIVLGSENRDADVVKLLAKIK